MNKIFILYFYFFRENWESELLLIVCSNYISTIKQNLKDYSQNHSPLPPPIEDKKPALPSKWSFDDNYRIIDEIDGASIESPKIVNKKIKTTLLETRPPLEHEAFNLETYKKTTNIKIKKYIDEMVKNVTPHLAMHLCPVYKLELSKNFILSETTKYKFPFLEKINEIFSDGIDYDKKIKLHVKEEKQENLINITNLMQIIDQLELDEYDNIENILNDYI